MVDTGGQVDSVEPLAADMKRAFFVSQNVPIAYSQSLNALSRAMREGRERATLILDMGCSGNDALRCCDTK